MTTRLVGMKEFRQNMASFAKKARKQNIRYIVLKKNVPVLEIRPVDEKKFAMEKLTHEIKEARKQVKEGNVYTHEEIMKEFGLK
ncbi:hypothetical protein HYV57_02360 [Candidatus Peregrinibacteria bacterium]|nr:hypothetical protein [Candidatus Peregrinibacteria bacterium]